MKPKLGVENSQVKLADHHAAAPLVAPPLPPYSVHPYPPGPVGAPFPSGPMPGAFPAGVYPPGPYPSPNLYAANPNLTYMDSLVRQTEEENKKLQEELDRIRNDDTDFRSADDDIEALKK